MNESSQIARALHEDHMAVLALLQRLETACLTATPPGAEDGVFRALSSELVAAVETEVRRHFDFEERDLFPALQDSGYGDLADLLTEEHGEIWPVATAVVERLRSARDGGWTVEAWSGFRPQAFELAERLQSHIEKEERALAEAVADTFEGDDDAAIAMAYAAA